MCVKCSVSEPFYEDGQWTVLVQVGMQTAYIQAGDEDTAKENATGILRMLKHQAALIKGMGPNDCLGNNDG